MKLLPMPADWCAEHTSDAAFRRVLFEAFRVPAHILYPNAPRIYGLIIVDPGMPAGSISLVADDGTTVRITNIGTGDA